MALDCILVGVLVCIVKAIKQWKVLYDVCESFYHYVQIDGLVQDCSNLSVLAAELLVIHEAIKMISKW